MHLAFVLRGPSIWHLAESSLSIIESGAWRGHGYNWLVIKIVSWQESNYKVFLKITQVKGESSSYTVYTHTYKIGTQTWKGL